MDKEALHTVALAALHLRDGGLVAFPTETVYGLGANARNAKAVARIFEVKRRPLFNPLIIHVSSLEDVASLVAEMPAAARKLADAFWPGPLTLVLPKRPEVPEIITAGLTTVAVRIPSHPIARALLQQAGVPIAAPSANRFSQISPTRAEHVRESLGDEVDFILDGGASTVGLESTIIGFVGDRPQLLRAGGLTLEEIEACIGAVVPAQLSEGAAPLAPGMLRKHYSPSTPLLFESSQTLTGRVGLLTFTEAADHERFHTSVALSSTGDLREAAANLYCALRELDARGLDWIVARPVPNQGLGLAINDRLRRAAR